ncbi:hypothetical protein SGODD07_00038 [Streptococcus gordonii]|uniref:Uncharacterized protein n=1 Tax=Streptococcus gordonii TaxID=1302 RepID=A0A139NGQ6_STRGN|nr:hypothetical protein SGODD07_00038 [Streptococcus gordonii]
MEAGGCLASRKSGLTWNFNQVDQICLPKKQALYYTSG